MKGRAKELLLDYWGTEGRSTRFRPSSRLLLSRRDKSCNEPKEQATKQLESLLLLKSDCSSQESRLPRANRSGR